MFAKLRTGLAVATRVLRPSSLYSAHSDTDGDSTGRDSVHSEPPDLYSNEGVYSPVNFGAAPYEVAMPHALRNDGTVVEVLYDTVEYCSKYDIYEEYGFDDIYEPVDYNSQVQAHVYVTCCCKHKVHVHCLEMIIVLVWSVSGYIII